MHSYYFSQIVGGRTNRDAPPELIELSLIEKFGWTPKQIDEIPIGKLQRLFAVMEQRDQSIDAARQAKDHNQKNQKKK